MFEEDKNKIDEQNINDTTIFFLLILNLSNSLRVYCHFPKKHPGSYVIPGPFLNLQFAVFLQFTYKIPNTHSPTE